MYWLVFPLAAMLFGPIWMEAGWRTEGYTRSDAIAASESGGGIPPTYSAGESGGGIPPTWSANESGGGIPPTFSASESGGGIPPTR
jgi:hypothetical protein